MTENPDNNQQNPSEQPDAPKPKPQLAGKSLRAIIFFLLVTTALIATDLIVKHYSFEYVGKYPVEILPGEPGMQPTDHPPLTLDRKRVQIHVFEKETDLIPAKDEPVVVIPKLLNLHLTLNPGAVFGIGKGGRSFFISISVLAIFAVSFYFMRSNARAYVFHIGLAFILAGALGNMYDRAVYGVVRDMFHMLPGTRLWPWIFNVADVELIIGVALVFLHGLFYSDEQLQQPKK